MPQRVYATLKRRYSLEALCALRFRDEGGQMVKRGVGRSVRAIARSADGVWWLVTPCTRDWKR